MTSHAAQALASFDDAIAALRLAVDDHEVDPVDTLNCESLLMGWRRDRVLLAAIAGEG